VGQSQLATWRHAEGNAGVSAQRATAEYRCREGLSTTRVPFAVWGGREIPACGAVVAKGGLESIHGVGDGLERSGVRIFRRLVI